MNKNLSIDFFKTIFDIFPDPLLIIKKDNLKIQDSNVETQNLFRKSNNYLIGKKLDEIFSHQKLIVSSVNEIKNQSGSFTIKDNLKLEKSLYEIRLIFFSELEENFLMILKKVFNDNQPASDNNLDYFSEMFSILSHEINNPISSIKLASDLINKKYNVDKELIEIIQVESLRITRLFENFNITKINPLTKKTNENIHELIRLSLFKIKQMPNKLKIIEEFDPSLPSILVSRDLIIQVFDNLLNNAYESSQFKGNSFIKIESRFVVGETIKIPNLKNFIKKNSIKIIISDNGFGVSNEHLNKLFLPLFSTKKSGSGIGLFLVKKIIDDHEGHIVIESKNGITKVTMTLPY